MLQTIFKLISFLLIPSGLLAFPSQKIELRKPLKSLFSHQAHLGAMKSTGTSCTDCHRFSIKSSSFDPLAKNVGLGGMAVSQKVCHECHRGKVEVARVNQCSLCHQNTDRLAPPSHQLAWKSRHGAFAQMNPTSCSGCHQENQTSCLNCHSQKNTLKSQVHRPQFRLTHSLEARSNPAKCATCHSSIDTCIRCHGGGIPK